MILTSQQQQAVDLVTAAIRSKFPEASPLLEAGPAGLTLRVGVSPARFSEIESVMMGTLTDVMLTTGVLLVLTP